MEKIIIAIIVLFFSISLCLGQNVNIQGAVKDKKELELRYQNAIESAQKNFSQRQYAQAKLDYLIAIELKPENTNLINEIIAEIDKLLPLNKNQSNQEIQNRSSPATNYTGTMVPGETLTAKFDWLVRNAESHNTYIVEVNANENIAPRTLGYKGAINITIILRGDHINRTIRLSSHGTMITVNSNVTFILENNITLQGHKDNTGSMVKVDGGHFIMDAGATIMGNHSTGYQTSGGVFISDGTFEMKGGSITNNEHAGAVSHGKSAGGVVVGRFIGQTPANFTMSGGIISNNKDQWGGGVHVSGSFTFSGGTISGNTAWSQGGGVYVDGGGNFVMTGGTIINNSAVGYGGGVYVSGNFTKKGGTITGYSSNQSNGNVVKDDSGVIARRGHAVYFNDRRSTQRKETTAGTEVNLSSSNTANWDQ